MCISVGITPKLIHKTKILSVHVYNGLIPVCILSARARETAKYIIYVRSMHIVQRCLSSLLCSRNMSLLD